MHLMTNNDALKLAIGLLLREKKRLTAQKMAYENYGVSYFQSSADKYHHYETAIELLKGLKDGHN